jgi:hypothetical protein
MKELQIENRIALLKSRGRENGNIVKKLERKCRKLQKNKQN